MNLTFLPVLKRKDRYMKCTTVLDNMHDHVTFTTEGNGLWEIDKWEMGFGWLQWLRGFGIGNSWEKGN